MLLVRVFSTNVNPPKISRVRWTVQRLFGKYLFLTNTLTCGAMMGIGDLIQQKIEKYGTMHKTTGYDWPRTARMLAVGLAQGPPQHMFYTMLDRFVPGRVFKAICIKIVLDQLIASPMCIGIFFLGLGALEGKDLTDEFTELRNKFWTVYMVDWMVWPPTQFINFYFLAPKYRVTYINFMTMLYDIFLSYVHHDL